MDSLKFRAWYKDGEYMEYTEDTEENYLTVIGNVFENKNLKEKG